MDDMYPIIKVGKDIFIVDMLQIYGKGYRCIPLRGDLRSEIRISKKDLKHSKIIGYINGRSYYEYNIKTEKCPKNRAV
jgi:hypothetical protein